ncbi:ABC transporter ATP-binding protein [Gottschalkiaceae bacterium SANA]|nr:ABC transporter ATP-binding protein [Gottschalkiaceae bacterium SANA]
MKSLRRIYRYMSPYKKWALIAPILVMFAVLAELMQPAIMQRMVDTGVAEKDMPYILKNGGFLILMALIGAFGGIVSAYYASKASMSMARDLRRDLFVKIQSLSFPNLDQLETGQLITRLTNDVTQVQTLSFLSLRLLIRAPIMLIGSVVMALIVSPQLAWIMGIMIPLLLIILTLVIRKAFPIYKQVQGKLDSVNQVVQENLSGIRVIKAFVRKDFENNRFNTVNHEYRDISVKAAHILAMIFPVILMILNLAIVAAIWYGGGSVIAGDMQIGQIMSFINYIMLLLMSLMMVAMVMMNMSRAEASASRILEVLDATPAVLNQIDPVTPASLYGEVEFRDVCFAYQANCADPVLKNINLTISPGKTLAILGSTGSGKSTLVQLIPRFYDTSQGQVLIDGINVKTLSKEWLRSQIGFAMQKAVLFSGTIRENLTFGRPNTTEEEMIHAAKIAQAHDFITKMPDGYDTYLEQRGVNLSGGQKQRIAIARALVTDPAILILDDSTSAVDVETEVKIRAALKHFMKNRTSILIAQRISSVMTADTILVLDDGALESIGTHDSLMKKSAVYRELYDSQLGGDDNE